MSLIMKNVAGKILVCLALLCGVAAVQAGNVYICEDPDMEAVLPSLTGNIDDAVTRFANKNFRYPPEAWRMQKWFGVEIMGLVDVDGHVIEIELMTDETPHPLLVTELRRVMEKMEWYPALKNGIPVATWKYFYLPLTRKSARSDCWVPIGMEERFDLVNLYAFEWEDPDWNHGAEEMRKAHDCFGESMYLFPGYAPAAIAYARLLATEGRGEQALSQIDIFLSGYQANGYRVEVTQEGDTLLADRAPEYSGRTELWTATVRALLHDMMQSPGRDTAYTDAIALADRRITDGLLFPECTSKNDMGLFSNMHLLKYIKDQEEKEELAAEIRQEKADRRAGRKADTKDQLNVFGTKAMLIWLMEGDAALDRWMAQIRAGKPGKKLLKYLTKIEKSKAEHAALLEDRAEVVKALAMMVLLDEEADPSASSAFYARRKAMEEVFPLRWLTE